MTDNDDEILKRALEIKADRGLSLTDAMLAAESELHPEPVQTLPESFMVEIPVKPRVARWIQQTFGGHPEFTVEHRLGAYLATVLNKTRVKTIRDNETPPEIQKGSAVSLRREHMKVPE